MAPVPAYCSPVAEQVAALEAEESRFGPHWPISGFAVWAALVKPAASRTILTTHAPIPAEELHRASPHSGSPVPRRVAGHGWDLRGPERDDRRPNGQAVGGHVSRCTSARKLRLGQ
jgi:hypothetical protein